jgi:hypothetical protein
LFRRRTKEEHIEVRPGLERRPEWEIAAGLWLFDGRPQSDQGIPHEAKALYLLRAIRAIDATTFVESGTYLGDMVALLLPYVEEVHTIELSPELHGRAVERFRADPNVHLHLGDSGVLLAEVLEGLDDPAVIYLDGHYSEGVTSRGALDTAVREELRAIAESSERHAVIIDDARGFGVWPDYPSTEEIATFVRGNLNDYVTIVDTDEICVLPREIKYCLR